MTRHATRWMVVLALAALPPAVAGPVDYQGRAGVGYERLETWTGADHGLNPRLRWDGYLDASGSLVDRGFIDWGAGAGYDATRFSYSGVDTASDGFVYNARLSLLDGRQSRLSLGGFASRSRVDFSTDLATRTTGATTTDAYSVTARGGGGSLPAVRAGFSSTDTTNIGFDRNELTRSSKVLDVGLRPVTGPFAVDVDYRTTWDQGGLLPYNYTSQLVRFAASVPAPSKTASGSLTADYFLREPSVVGAGNPRFEETRVAVGTQWGERREGFGSYSYAHSLAADPESGLREQASHTLSATQTWRVSPEWETLWNASAGTAQNRLDGREEIGAGESVGLIARWRRLAGERSYGLDAGASVGISEPVGQPNRLGYGVSAGALAGGPLSWGRYTAQYSVSFSSDLGATWGNTLSQTAYAEANAILSSRTSAGLRLSASAARRDSFFGASANRSISAQGLLTRESLRVQADVGVSDGLSGPLANPLSDGLFLPAGYDTHTRFAGVSATQKLARRLSLSGAAKYSIASGPGTPDQRELALFGALQYAVGLWSFSLEERYSAGGILSYDQRANQVFLRATRAFGGQF